ncbi:MAG: WD40 repeat domain-containing protein [Ktedonobacteraceae bacterium]
MISLERLYIYDADGTMLQDLAWSSNGKYLAACGGLVKPGPNEERLILKAEVLVWEALTGTTMCRYTHHQDVPTDVSWSPDSSRIASGGWDRTVHLWEAITGQQLGSYTGHANFVTAIDWSPDGTRILSAGSDLAYRSQNNHAEQHIWDVQTRETLITYAGYTDTIFSARWSPDGIKIASGGYDHTAQVWKASTGKHLFTYDKHTDCIFDVAWSPDGSAIASASQDHTLQVWECLSGQLRYQRTSTWNRAMMKVAWSPDGNYLAVVSSAGELLNGRTGEVIRKFGPANAGMGRIVWSPKGTHLAFLQETSAQVLRVKYE